MSNTINLTEEELNAIIKDATIYGIGTLKVSNMGNSWAMVKNGQYIVKRFGHQEIRKTSSRKVLYNIFFLLINRYHNFEYKGYRYNYDRGGWHKYPCAK